MRQRCWFGVLGLFALALQLVLPIGHRHEHYEGQRPGAHLAATCEPGITEPCRAGSHDQDDGDEHCAICRAMTVAAGVVLPALIALTIAAERIIAPMPRAGLLLVEHCSGRPFRARAPPVSASG